MEFLSIVQYSNCTKEKPGFPSGKARRQLRIPPCATPFATTAGGPDLDGLPPLARLAKVRPLPRMRKRRTAPDRCARERMAGEAGGGRADIGISDDVYRKERFEMSAPSI